MIHKTDSLENVAHPLYLRCINSLGNLYNSCGWTNEAVEMLEYALHLHSEACINPEGHASVFLGLAKAYYSREMFKQSFDSCEMAEKMIRNIIKHAEVSENNM